MSERIRVLVVDDSAFMRHTISEKLLCAPDLEVVGRARDGIEALKMTKDLDPDVVTLDVEMPRMDGLTALGRIMEECPRPVVMVSALTSKGAEATFRALELGAVDFVAKPDANAPLDITRIKDDLLAKVRSAARVPISKLRPYPKVRPACMEKAPCSAAEVQKVVVVGSSTGGPRALHEMVPRLPVSLPAAVVLVQHMPPGFTKSLAGSLNSISALAVKEAQAGDVLKVGNILVAPGDYHLLVNKDGVISLDKGPRVHGVRPSVDITMESVAKSCGSRTVGVILTGMGRDGTTGAGAVRAAGGKVIAEDEDSCVVYGMPGSAVQAGNVDRIVPLGEIADEILRSL